MTRKPIYLNNNFALGVLIVCALLSIVFGGARSLNAVRHKAVAVFEHGVDGDGVSVKNDMQKRADKAWTIIAIAEKYPELAASTEALRNAANNSSAEDIDSLYVSDDLITKYGEILYTNLQNVNLSEKDTTNLKNAYNELRSRGNTIAHDGYNELAQKYNQLLSKGHAAVLRAVGLVKPLSYYGIYFGGVE
ncbi:hypothetical protein FACS189490_13680 [Clostridia bacterium]|nr:hypothetical protein FACS189490_13680 [Clostridia bacterium]